MKTVSLPQQFLSLYKRHRQTVHFLQGGVKLLWFFYVEEMSSKDQNKWLSMPINFALFKDNVNW